MILVDSGVLVALFNPRDRFHARAFQQLDQAQEQWITTWPVVTECCYLIDSRVHEDAKQAFMQEVTSGDIVLWDIPQTDAKRIPALMKKYANLPMDLADASLVLLAESLGHGRILTTDQRDFGSYRWKNTKPFVDLMGQPAPALRN